MSLKNKITVIGAGNLGAALIAGLYEANAAGPGSLVAADASKDRLSHLKKQLHKIQTLRDNAAAVRGADVIVLAVKPHIIPTVLDDIAEALTPKQLVISLAAAVPIRLIEARLPAKQPVIRAMPNIAMTVHESATALCWNAHAREAHRRDAQEIFSTVGRTVLVSESQMHAVTALSGSGPAYVFTILEGLTAGGVKMGLPSEIAQALAAQTLLGAATMALESGLHPGQLRDQVTTPGGTTIAGLHELELGGVRGALMSAVEAAAERSVEMARLLQDAEHSQ